MPVAKSPILEDLNLQNVYSLPHIYDGVLEVFHPEAVYTMNSVYEHPPTNVKVSRIGVQNVNSQVSGSGSSEISREKFSHSQVDFSTGDTEKISAQILEKQAGLLTKLKSLRVELDGVEKVLRKEKNSGAPGIENSPSDNSVEFTESLKRAAGNVESVRSLIVKQEEGILSRAKNLHQKLDDLEKAARSGKKSTSVLRKKVLLAKVEELVVSADPRYPPLSLLAAANFLIEHGLRVAATTYVHSSVENVPDNLRNFLKEVATTENRSDADIILSLTWKNVGTDPTLVVDPSRQNPILAEANIARYVLRVLNSDYDTVGNLTEFVANDKWLNLASRSLVQGNAKERQSAVRQLNGHLGKSAFLTGSDVSLVDAVVASALLHANEYKNLSGNVKKWSLACIQTELFSSVKNHLVI